jgi:hypothetical protein
MNLISGINVNLEGNKSEEYNLAAWEKDGISYSIYVKSMLLIKKELNLIMKLYAKGWLYLQFYFANVPLKNIRFKAYLKKITSQIC